MFDKIQDILRVSWTISIADGQKFECDQVLSLNDRQRDSFCNFFFRCRQKNFVFDSEIGKEQIDNHTVWIGAFN